jgi:hypothetical protein
MLAPMTSAVRLTDALRLEPGGAALAAGAAAVIAAEWLRGAPTAATGRWFLLEAVAAAAALAVAWRRRHHLQGAQILVLGVLFMLALAVVRHHVGSHGDTDVNDNYRLSGNALRHGNYPAAEYPTGSVLLFALETAVGSGRARTPNAFLMVGFQLIVLAALLAVRSPVGFWLVAVVAFWPANAYFWENRFDLAPTAFLVAGLVVAHRGRFAQAGALLGVGAALKWSPALAALFMFASLLASRETRAAIAHATGFVVAFGVLTVPFLVWNPHNVLHAYSAQGGRSLTAEAFLYPPLRLLGVAHVNRSSGYIWDTAAAPGWASDLALAIQIAMLAVTLFLALRCRDRTAAIVLAAAAPCFFLLTNRVFSPQYAITLLACWMLAALLLFADRRMLFAGSLALVATAANALVYPARVQQWVPFSTLFFCAGLALTSWLVIAAVRRPKHEGPPLGGPSPAP